MKNIQVDLNEEELTLIIALYQVLTRLSLERLLARKKAMEKL